MLFPFLIGRGNIKKIADLLLDAGADPCATSVTGRTPLHELFCRSGDVAVSNSIPLIDENYFSARHASLRHGTVNLARAERRAVLRSLLHWGAEPLQTDRKHGLSALHYCAKEDAIDCMTELLWYLGVSENHEQNKSLERPMTRKLKDEKQSSLQRDKCGPYYCCRNGRTCLHIAAASSSPNIMALLTQWDVDKSILGSTRMALFLSNSRWSTSTNDQEYSYFEYCLVTMRDCSGKIPAQLVGQGGSVDLLTTFWEHCYSGNITRYC